MKRVFKRSGIIGLAAVIVFMLAGCEGLTGGGDDDPEITGMTFTPADDLVEGTSSVEPGSVVGTFGNPQGGTSPFTYRIVGGQHRDLFTIVETDLKIAGTSALTKNTYKINAAVRDSKGKEFTAPIEIVVKGEGEETGGEEGDEWLTGTVSIGGKAIYDNVLTANTDNLEGTGTLTYQWQSTTEEYFLGTEDENIQGATNATLKLGLSLVDKKVRVKVGRTGYSNKIESDPKYVYMGPPGQPEAKFNGNTLPDGYAVPIGSVINLSSETEGGLEVRFYYTEDSEKNPDPVNEVGQEIGTTLPITKNVTIRVVAAYRDDIDIVSAPLILSLTVTSPPESLTWQQVPDTKHGIPVTNQIFSHITFGGGTFVALTPGGDVAYTKDGGDSWSIGNKEGLKAALDNKGITDLVFVDGKFFVLGTGAQMAHSTDGLTWTGVGIGDAFQYDTDATENESLSPDSVCGLAYGSGVYVAAGRMGTIAYSSDLETWNRAGDLITNGTGETRNRTIAYANNTFILGMNGEIQHSSNGTSWTKASIPDHALGNDYISIVYGGPAGEEQFYALSDGSSTNLVFWSETGENWVKATTDVLWYSGTHLVGFPATTKALAPGGGRLVAVSLAGEIFWSDDKGVNWLARTHEQTGVFISPTKNNIAIRDIAYGNGVFIAVGGGGSDGADSVLPAAIAVSNLHEPQE